MNAYLWSEAAPLKRTVFCWKHRIIFQLQHECIEKANQIPGSAYETPRSLQLLSSWNVRQALDPAVALYDWRNVTRDVIFS